MNEALQAGELLLEPTYETGLVALSYCISVLGAFVALTAAQHIRTGRGISWLNLLAAGTALGGIGVWSMHFTGMLVLNLSMASGYSAFETIISLIAAIGATCLALGYVAKAPGDNARVLKEEIFGPCCHIMPFDNEEEVLAKANDNVYGLACAIWTRDVARAHRVAQRMNVGTSWVNSWFLRDLRTPFGGAKQSGIGREGGVHSLEFYTELKNVCIKL